MRNLSIRFRITLWFTAALIVAAGFTCFVILYADHQIIQKTIRDNLVETVENNVDEVEYYLTIDRADPEDTDYYIAFGTGYLEIDDDFLDQVNEVCTALYHENGALLYGENPVSRNISDLKFADSEIQRIKIKGSIFYIYDRKLESEGLEAFWLRGVVSGKQGMTHMSNTAQLSLLFLPLLVLVSAMGGYLLTGGMLRPVQEILKSADAIGTGGDLKKRIELGRGNDELHQLAASFNKMFERLEYAFEAEQKFTADASHELRTPVSVITAQCEYSLERPRSCEEYEHALRTIQRQGRKMTKLINSMLEFTRLEMRTESYAKESIDLTELVESVCSDMALIQERGITLKCETEEHIVFCGNSHLLSRLLINLITNAYRYGKENGCIIVCLRTRGHQIELSVSDDGIGIAREEQLKIFQRFYQGDNSHSGRGTGLGLSMVQEITRFHGGMIQVNSEPGKGSTFHIIFNN